MPEARTRPDEPADDGSRERDARTGRAIASRDAYLSRVAAVLGFDDPERAQVLEELAGHLDDSIARLRAGGAGDDRAEADAIDRLGQPEALARELARARRTPRRLAAAAGAGTWAAATGGLHGLLVGSALAVLGSVIVSVVAPIAAQAFGRHWSGFDAGASSAVTLIVLGIAAHAIGRTLTPVMAARAGYRIGTTRRWTTAAGALLLLTYALVGWRGNLSWVSVAALLALPAWYAAGAWNGERIEFRARGWIAAGIMAMAVLVTGTSLVSGIGTGIQGTAGAEPVPVSSPDPAVNDRIGLPAPAALASATLASSTGSAGADGRIWVSVVFRNAAALGGWRDLRVDAWQGVDGSTATGWRCVDPAATAPLAVGPVQVTPAVATPEGSIRYPVPNPAMAGDSAWPAGSVMASGSVGLDTIPGLGWACLALTGIAPDGAHRILEGPQLIQTNGFTGTAWDWFAAVLARR